ncbi:MAG: hypothetical protein ACYCYO_15030 [Bacilli bacterium]
MKAEGAAVVTAWYDRKWDGLATPPRITTAAPPAGNGHTDSATRPPRASCVR